MNKDIEKKLSQITKSDSVDTIIGLLEIPDEEFDQAYPIMKEKIKEVFQTPEIEQEVRNQLKMTPVVNMEAEKKAIEDFIKEIQADSSISKNKRDVLVELLQHSLNLTCQLVINPREKIKVKVVKINEDVILPQYAHETDAGADIFAFEDCELAPSETKIVKTGLKVAIPAGYEIQIRPRSGMSLKTPLRVANSPATIDAEYRGEIGIIMQNTGTEPITITKGSKIAQMLIAPTPMIKWEEVTELDSTERGSGGYGSTDKS